MNTPTHIVFALAAVAVSKEHWTLEDRHRDVVDDKQVESGSGNRLDSDDSPAMVPMDRKRIPARWLWAAAVGGFLPDAPLFAFYAYQKLIARSSEQLIWSTLYFAPQWQDFFDCFNSIPLFAVGLAMAIRFRQSTLVVMAAAVLLHLICDLPVHHDDGHRHFWPLSDWKFASPVSYWDPAHHGILASVVEYALFVAATLLVLRAHQGWVARTLVLVMGLVHTLMMAGIWFYFYWLA